MNLAITHELLQLKWEICRKLNRAFHVLGFYWLTEIQSDSLLYVRENKESVWLVSFITKFWFCGEKIAQPKKMPQDTAR